MTDVCLLIRFLRCASRDVGTPLLSRLHYGNVQLWSLSWVLFLRFVVLVLFLIVQKMVLFASLEVEQNSVEAGFAITEFHMHIQQEQINIYRC